jgi:hypothetical protein
MHHRDTSIQRTTSVMERNSANRNICGLHSAANGPFFLTETIFIFGSSKDEDDEEDEEEDKESEVNEDKEMHDVFSSLILFTFILKHHPIHTHTS